MRWTLDIELEAEGPNPEFDVLVPVLFVSPAREQGTVPETLAYAKGSLVWKSSGNDVGTDECLIFDICSFYAHNECKSR